jgi:hypothetical protein
VGSPGYRNQKVSKWFWCFGSLAMGKALTAARANFTAPFFSRMETIFETDSV